MGAHLRIYKMIIIPVLHHTSNKILNVLRQKGDRKEYWEQSVWGCVWRYNELYKIYGDDNKSTTTPLSWSSIQHIDNATIFRSHGEMLLNVRNSKATAPLSLSCLRRLPGYKIMLCENCQYPQLNSFPNSFLWKDYRKITIQEEF